MNLRPFLCLTSIVALSLGIQAKPLPEVYHGQREIVDAANAPSAILIIRPEDTTTRFAIRPDVDTSNVYVFNEYFPSGNRRSRRQDNRWYLPQKQKRAKQAHPWELSLTASLSRGRCDSPFVNAGKSSTDNHAGLEVNLSYRWTDLWSTGLTTGYMHSVGPFATRYLPWIITTQRRFQEIHHFTPYVEGYIGLLFGISQGRELQNDTNYPNTWKMGLRAGASYPLGKGFSLRGALQFFLITDNSNATYGHTKEWGFGLCGSITYNFH